MFLNFRKIVFYVIVGMSIVLDFIKFKIFVVNSNIYQDIKIFED